MPVKVLKASYMAVVEIPDLGQLYLPCDPVGLISSQTGQHMQHRCKLAMFSGTLEDEESAIALHAGMARGNLLGHLHLDAGSAVGAASVCLPLFLASLPRTCLMAGGARHGDGGAAAATSFFVLRC